MYFMFEYNYFSVNIIVRPVREFNIFRFPKYLYTRIYIPKMVNLWHLC